MNPLETLRHHVTGAIERGEKQAIAGVTSRKHFQKMTCGNVLTEVLREIERARKELEKGNPSHAQVHLEYVETIIDDACHEYGSSAVFGVMEISALTKRDEKFLKWARSV
jgi:hypothetical protein